MSNLFNILPLIIVVSVYLIISAITRSITAKKKNSPLLKYILVFVLSFLDKFNDKLERVVVIAIEAVIIL